jgi:hypothetical protein
MKNRSNIYTAHIVLAFVILISLSGCKKESTELKAMLKSADATTQITTGSEISRYVQERETNPLVGKPKQPEVRIDYEPLHNYTKEDIYNEIVAILEENGWERDELSIPQSGYYRANLLQDGFIIVAEVQIHSKLNIVSIYLRTIPG